MFRRFPSRDPSEHAADGHTHAGGSVDVVDLPQAGIRGNSHMVMMDKNNLEVAGLIQKWLEGKGLTK